MRTHRAREKQFEWHLFCFCFASIIGNGTLLFSISMQNNIVYSRIVTGKILLFPKLPTAEPSSGRVECFQILCNLLDFATISSPIYFLYFCYVDFPKYAEGWIYYTCTDWPEVASLYSFMKWAEHLEKQNKIKLTSDIARQYKKSAVYYRNMNVYLAKCLSIDTSFLYFHICINNISHIPAMFSTAL